MSRYTYDTDRAPLLIDTQRAELDEQADALREWEAARREPRGFCGYSWTWWLMVAICGACALFFTFSANAAGRDTWTGPDKQQHMIGSLVIGAIASSVTESPAKGMGVCMAVGLGKEMLDASGMGMPSAKDLVADAIGCAAGVAFDHWVLVPAARRGGGVTIGYRSEF